MKRKLFFKGFIGVIAFFLTLSLQAQVINGSSYNIDVHFTQGYGKIDDEFWPHEGAPDQTFISTARNDTDYNTTVLFSTTRGVANNPKTCYTQNLTSDVWGSVVSQSMGVIYGNTTGRFDYHVLAWEDNVGDRCIVDNDDDQLHSYAHNLYFLGSPSSQWTPWEADISFGGTLTPAKIRAKYTWRFGAGDKGNALDFGTLTSGTKTHLNHNRSSPVGGDTYVGYRNQWSGTGFTSGNDVTYKFTINTSKKVTLSTNYPSIVNAADGIKYTSLTLLNSSESVIATNSYIGGNMSQIIKDLCPGTYYVVVEGINSANLYKGKFQLGVTVDPLTVTPGSLAYPSVSTICPGQSIPTIPNSVAATSTLGSISYKWYRTIYENGSPVIPWQHIAAAGTGASSADLGTLAAGQTAYIYRIASDCGSQAGTSQVVIGTHNRTLTAGSISGATLLPYPQEVTGNILNSTANASASPSQSITWEKSTNGGISWSNADNTNNGQSYTIPSNLSATTKFRRKIANTCDGVGGYNGKAYSNEQEVKVINPNGVLQGKVRSPSQSGVNNVTISLTRTTAVPGGQANKTYTTTTGTDGAYAIPGIYYGESDAVGGGTANFVVTPSKGDHVFNPISLNKTLNFQIPSLTEVDFIDESVFSITGNVVQECATCVGGTVSQPITCPIKDVEFLINGQYLSNNSITDGTYALSVSQQGNYRIKPRFLSHQFAPDSIDLAVGEDLEIPNVNFVDTTTHVISGYVKADCEQYIGQANLTFSQVLPDVGGSPVAPCFVHNLTTNSGSGFYSIRLPAGKYKVSVNSFSNIPSGSDFNSAEMAAFLNAYPLDSLVRDITSSDTTMNLIFEERPQIQAFGLEGPNCSGSPLAGSNNLDANPIFAQSTPRTFTVKVFQGDPAKGCAAKDSVLTIFTNIQGDDTNEQFDSLTVNGIKAITLTADQPNIIAPYHKTLSFNFTDVWGRSATPLVLTPVVTGIKTSIGTFATVSPQIPFLILRDPPGDASSSSWSQNTKIETANRFFGSKNKKESIWSNVRVGAEFEAGFGVTIETKVWADLGLNITTSGTSKNAREVILSSEIKQSYSTANNPEIIGSIGDIYVGAAMNLKYAPINEIFYSPDSCSFYRESRMMIANDGFATTYSYSENHILNTLIPDLTGFRDMVGNTQAEIDKWQDQINVWHQVVDNNTKLKREAKFVENVSFDGATGPQSSSVTTSSSGVSTVEFALELDEQVALQLGLEIAGAGINGGVTANFKMETGEAETTTQTTSTTTEFTIDDDDAGDFFSVDIKTDPVYNTPVFDLVAGTSSCPYEEGTQPRDDISFSVVGSPLQSGVPANGQAIYNLNIGNTSQSEEARTYFVRYVTSSSTGATVTIEGNGVGPFDYPLNYLQNQDLTVGVTRFNPNVYSFEGMTFQAYDACESGNVTKMDVKKEVQIHTNFQNACSPVTLALPENGFVVNSNSNNLLPIQITDYVWANLDNIEIEYSIQGSNQWNSGVTLQKAQIQNNAFGTLLNFDVTNLVDGNYSFRLKLKCGLQTIISQRATGVIDRKPPLAFGAPQPLDDIYSLGDEISHSFNENLSCNSISAFNFSFKRLSNDATVPAEISCYNNKIKITPTVDLTPWLGDSLEVVLTNIIDANGNPSPNAFTWNFNIGNDIVNTLIPYFANINTPSSGFSTSASTSSTSTTISEDELGFLSVDFSIGSAASDTIVVYFIVAGTATFGSDYTVSGHRTYNGNEGAITIPKGATKATLKIDPKGDAILEPDETIIFGILSGGGYNIGGSNKVTLSILNDDADDCENGGLPFTQNNNALGNTSLAADTYHKLILESSGKVQSPTTVVFKGEKSITLKPGFKADNGSIFIATLEDCPNVTTGSETNPKGEKNQSIGTFGNTSANSIFASNAITQEIGKDGMIKITFTSEIDQEFDIKLYNSFAALVEDFSSDEVYKIGGNSIELNTNELKTGTYIMKFIGKTNGKVSYHKVVIASNDSFSFND
ncbi:3-coathanger stack domain-containing protein [Arcticibacterium luteifluviistationis]|uniref:SbsA Ig-like domain-containing protein n=1 Tax=Arcticibacterium luteifluviistationis TaxID=1784714 RepID=A0A2Z4G735_9BACT|nr:3-coathanger stack domain-containing protein [Arcticibacterium luteifluviistationis]AWV96955.1 hypothetical protein DJ013_01695 [Arcticibacterium luteifluviistationis]